MSSTVNGAEQSASKAAFNAAVNKTLYNALAVSDQRGGEYSDSWALENQQTSFLDMVLDAIGKKQQDASAVYIANNAFTRQEKRLIMVASLCDVKVSRMLGGFKADTLDDLINYTAALRTWLADYCAVGSVVKPAA